MNTTRKTHNIHPLPVGYISYEEAAKRLGKRHKTQISRLVRTGKLTACKPNADYIYCTGVLESDIEKMKRPVTGIRMQEVK